MNKNKFFKIAAYVRVSTEEQAKQVEGSIKSQQQRLDEFVKFKNLSQQGFGEIVEVYIDRAKSGKNQNRPALKRMLADVGSGKIDLICVTELSRLSRSIKDFSQMWEFFQKNKCSFLSLREHLLYQIAQFERSQCSERISANFLARAKRGLYNGGPIALGYKLDPDKKGHLLIDEENALVVKEAFATFLREGALVAAGKSLNERGFRIQRKRSGGGGSLPRLPKFTAGNLYTILKNRGYTGKRSYTENEKQKWVKACWEPIINENTFFKVDQILKKNYRRLKTKTNKRYPYLISGMGRCGKCGDKLVGKSAHGNSGKVAYYEHGWATRKQACLNKKSFKCHPHRVQAKVLEPLVWEKIIQLLRGENFAKDLINEAHQLHKELSPDKIFKQLKKMEEEKAILEESLKRHREGFGTKEIPIGLKDYKNFLRKINKEMNLTLPAQMKHKIAKLLIHEVKTFDEHIEIHFKTGMSLKSNFCRLAESESVKASVNGATQPTNLCKKNAPAKNIFSPGLFFYDFGSNTIDNGGR